MYYCLIQCTYNCILDLLDSSGIVFTYVDRPREHNAGVMPIGHQASRRLIIPPHASNYTVTGFCSTSCTKKVKP